MIVPLDGTLDKNNYELKNGFSQLLYIGELRQALRKEWFG